MGVAVFFGCTFVAFGPAFSLFLVTVAGDPLRVIILVAGQTPDFNMASSSLVLLFLSCFRRFSDLPTTSYLISGLSFGIISGVFSVINILADALGPGVVGIHGDSPYYFLTSAFLTAAIILLHTFWGIVFFDACERRRYWALGLVIGSHLLTSGLTFLNPWYEASLLPIYAVTLSMGIWAFITAGGSLRSIQRSLSCRRQEDSRVMVYSALRIPPED
ncbi:gamma-secretase subunit APH-1A isoform X3 [Dromiciops gliroides]|uniref:gamma-secretase subunit APH-1A isoform X3 n=1 Tax=Dromiciops gliroides TaxID=33562 RepID=UPI001CC76B90|nr:gamma-secretase subunit APH-1A isoform X3 [Dromiciops gliroides]